ncbi:unnamed protein product [Leuciscus chuanchicus]
MATVATGSQTHKIRMTRAFTQRGTEVSPHPYQHTATCSPSSIAFLLWWYSQAGKRHISDSRKVEKGGSGILYLPPMAFSLLSYNRKQSRVESAFTITCSEAAVYCAHGLSTYSGAISGGHRLIINTQANMRAHTLSVQLLKLVVSP